MFSFFHKKPAPGSNFAPLAADMHAHWLPGIDDGAQTIEESLALIAKLAAMGYRHLWASPHVYHEYYPNTSASILKKLEEVQQAVTKAGIDVQLNTAAEYFVDEHFEQLLEADDLLCLPGKHVLIELSFFAPYPNFRQILFEMQLKGYKPILAHPERYVYYENNLSELETLRFAGCKLQPNLLSLAGHYGSGPKKTAERIIKNQWADFLGTDAHRSEHLHTLEKLLKNSSFLRILKDNTFENPNFAENA